VGIAETIILACVMMAAAFTLRPIRRGFGAVVAETGHMAGFDFAPAPPDTMQSPFGDVADALDSLEQAKTALRALGRYVPIDLVRELYAEKREPQLGGTLREVT